jgi:PilZ domain
MPDQPADRRGSPRYSVMMDAEATDLLTRSTVKLRCSDLSMSGCYLDTLNPLDFGTSLWIRLIHGQHIFESQGRVAYMVPRLGMGVAFAQPVPADQSAILSEWIAGAKGPSSTSLHSSASVPRVSRPW